MVSPKGSRGSEFMRMLSGISVWLRRRGFHWPWELRYGMGKTVKMEVSRTLSFFLSIVVTAVIVGVLIFGLLLAIVWPQLPSLEQITRYEPVLPLRVYTSDGALIGEFGVEKRNFTVYDEFPKTLIKAIVAAEDQRFFSHVGVDPVGIIRAVLAAAKSGTARSGASTITQQVARNFYLSQEKSLWRKIVEAMLALKIERELSKEKILEIYMNQIYLGERSFGFTAAARTYFGKDVQHITLAESAILASLPKNPSAANPISHPEKVLDRRNYVLSRMLSDGYITPGEFEAAKAEPLAKPHQIKSKKKEIEVEAGFVAEMARQFLVDKLKAEGVENPESTAYSKGYKIYTTIKAAEQKAAVLAVQTGLINFELRHGFRGIEKTAKIEKAVLATIKPTGMEDDLEKIVKSQPQDKVLKAAIVYAIRGSLVDFYIEGGERITIDLKKNTWLRRYANESGDKKLQIGSIVRFIKKSDGQTKQASWTLTNWPAVQSALVSLNPQTGEIVSLVGGYTFDEKSQFNRATQAWRQPGSTFKPFIISAAIELGIGPGRIYDDHPLFFPDDGTGNPWEPKNYGDEYDGPMSLRTALARSKNSVTIQVLEEITPAFAQSYIARFGFDAKRIPAVLALALGVGEVTPLQLASAYGMFANGGYRVNHWLVKEIHDGQNQPIYKYDEKPLIVDSNLVLDPRNVYIMNSLLTDVTRYGTAARVSTAFTRRDLAGKTGTTNDSVDTWFAGYQPNLVSVVWVGYDQPQKLGANETGGSSALPIWIDYMQTALKNIPEAAPRPQPENIGSRRGDLILKEFESGGGDDPTLEGEEPPYGEQGAGSAPNNPTPETAPKGKPNVGFF